VTKTDRILAGTAGVFFLGGAMQWIFDPASAARSLGLPLLDGLARSTEIGDLGAFFLSAATMVLWGTATANPMWLRAAAIMVASAALVRSIAWWIHGADFAAAFIAVEVAVAAGLSIIAARTANHQP